VSLDIRRGAEGDARALAELAARTFQETFAADNRPEDIALHVARAYGPSQQLNELRDSNVTTLLADLDGQLAGYAQLRIGSSPKCVSGEKPIELWRFYVESAWHGRGVAQALMTQVDLEARSRGAMTLWLGVWEQNERAKAFYRKAGFTDVGSQIFTVGSDAQTDRIMVRRIGSSGPHSV
jgi:ribosomal protein S18 acetylase RimI-like enzyme